MSSFITPETPPTAGNSCVTLSDLTPAFGRYVANVGVTKLYWVHAFNEENAVRYLQLHNLGGNPAGGAVPLLSARLPGPAEVRDLVLSFNPLGMFFSAGLVFALSSTRTTYTFVDPGLGFGVSCQASI
jgi:hypothetical protein